MPLSIAAKYKQYSRLRAYYDDAQNTPSHPKPASNTADSHNQLSRKRSCQSAEDPIRQKLFATPTKRSKPNSPSSYRSPARTVHPSQLDPYDSPVSLKRKLKDLSETGGSEALLAAIGPTPQRDGKALGLFDLNSPSSHKRVRPQTPKKVPGDERLFQTPSRSTGVAGDFSGSGSHGRKHSMTPASSARKFYLSSFLVTPTKASESAVFENEKTPSRSRSTPQMRSRTEDKMPESETPTFLRRKSFRSSHTAAHDTSLPGPTSPSAVRMPQKLFSRSLSSLANGFQVDEELAQIDASADEFQIPSDEVIRADSREGTPTSQRNSKPAIEEGFQWKRKAPRRTTKLTKMKPVRRKPVPANNSTSESTAPSQPDFLVYDSDNDAKEKDGSASTTQKKNRDAKASQNGDNAKSSQKGEKQGIVKKARAIKESAHANYRALKIRGKNKVKGGRFGRRRH